MANFFKYIAHDTEHGKGVSLFVDCSVIRTRISEAPESSS